MFASSRILDRSVPFPALSAAGSVRPVLAHVARRIALWRRRARERAELAGMTSVQLRDIRLNPADARARASTPFWRE